MLLRAFLTLLPVLPLAAQTPATLAGPTSGFLYDEAAHAVRLIIGVPGAAYLGAPVAERVDTGSISPDGRLAIVVREGRVGLLDLTTGKATDLTEWPGKAGRIAWSANSDAVAIAGERGLLVRDAGNTNGISVFESPGSLTGLAVANDGAVIASTSDGVYLLRTQARLVLPLAEVAGIALARGGDLFAVLRASKEVVRIRGWQESAEVSLFASAAAGLDEPAGVGISADEAAIYVADRAAKALFRFSATGELTGRQELDFVPSRLDRNGRFLQLTQRATIQDPVELLDAAGGTAFFIPAENPGTVAPVED
jgi:hypothetical protein